MNVSEARQLVQNFEDSQKKISQVQMDDLWEAIKLRSSQGWSSITFTEWDKLYPSKEQIEILHKEGFTTYHSDGGSFDIPETWTISWPKILNR